MFKEDSLPSPWESVILAPFQTMRQHVVSFKRRGIEDTPFRLNELLHKNAHLHATSKLDETLSDILDKAYKKDVKDGRAKGTKEQYFREEFKKATLYKTQMGNAWVKVLANQSRLGPQTVDRNDAVVAMTEAYSDRVNTPEGRNVIHTYKELSNVG